MVVRRRHHQHRGESGAPRSLRPAPTRSSSPPPTMAGRKQTVSKQVAVTEHVNEAPTAAFTTQVDRLSVDVNGSGSGDPGGSIASYGWNWGDGTPDGAGQTASHTYTSTAGSYTVTLTVTDDEGATATTTQDVSVADVVASDAFQRSATGGWGTADDGGAWAGSGGPLQPVVRHRWTRRHHRGRRTGEPRPPQPGERVRRSRPRRPLCGQGIDGRWLLPVGDRTPGGELLLQLPGSRVMSDGSVRLYTTHAR